jgi:formylmethanofuran dehydrogenase subunit E
MGKIEAAQKRLFRDVFICKNCGSKIRSEARKVAEGKARCRKCKKRSFRQVKKK